MFLKKDFWFDSYPSSKCEDQVMILEIHQVNILTGSLTSPYLGEYKIETRKEKNIGHKTFTYYTVIMWRP